MHGISIVKQIHRYISPAELLPHVRDPIYSALRETLWFEVFRKNVLEIPYRKRSEFSKRNNRCIHSALQRLISNNFTVWIWN